VASVELIGLLCAGSVKYHPAHGRSSSRESLSRSELAGLLSGLTGAQMDMALAKYGGDLASERQLIAHVQVWAAGVAVREGWRIVRGRPLVCNMAAIAVFEVVRPNCCGRCHGRGLLVNRSCPRCDGTGSRQLSGRDIAEAIGIEHGNYCRTWRDRYDNAYKYVQAIDSKVVIKFRHAEKNYNDLAFA
jgi:hypothetical protein